MPYSSGLASNRNTSHLWQEPKNFQRKLVRCFHTTNNSYKKKSGAEISASSWNMDDEDEDEDDEEDMLLDHRIRSMNEFEDDYDDEQANGLTNSSEEEEEERERYRLQQQAINDDLDQRKGRPWRDPWEITDDQWAAIDTGPDSIPDWNPSFVSRVALERLQVLSVEDGEGIPTLEALSAMTLPVSGPTLHPARSTKTYAAYRKSQLFKDVKDCVERLAKDRVQALLTKAKSNSLGGSGDDDDVWMDRQDAIDALFESLQNEAKADDSMDILSKHPEFPRWVERGLEDYLRAAQEQHRIAATSTTDEKKDEGDEAKNEDGEAKADAQAAETQPVVWKEGTPIFMDCYDPAEASPDGSKSGPMVPSILSPLAPHKHGGPGRMVEEWELSAHPTTKRILLRECTSRIAGLLATNDKTAEPAPRIYVHGKRGTGKSAVLASIVASARKSGCIVMYLPDGDRLRKNGFFVTPSTHPDRKGMFDLQDLSQEILQQLTDSHAIDLQGMTADRGTLEQYFKDTQLQNVDDYLSTSDGGNVNDNGSVSLVDLANYAQENKKHAPMCYSVVVHYLMQQQTEKKFVLVMDEFNCLFDHGQYFHMAYDEHVRKAIPCDRINLFEPIMTTMNISNKTAEQEEDEAVQQNETAGAATTSTSNASVIVGTTESHAVRKDITDSLTECATRRTTSSTENFHVVEVPRFSSLEADHVLANFEAVGVGKLRLDRGDTLMNSQEVEFLKMQSGSIGQKLLDVSII